jgi:hypothetical protein
VKNDKQNKKGVRLVRDHNLQTATKYILPRFPVEAFLQPDVSRSFSSEANALPFFMLVLLYSSHFPLSRPPSLDFLRKIV